ncbi:hypothetical protein ASPCAL03693 [Aspergillus calidoustus]|uniref:Small EDRK-rich factor-like N-terminal domain-containing protein n=1 Tax=Aspergillus calidoustus TaxID=454130 RepID=A0A0U5C433_ASPCI|nr:hypothetical protein ASPCAL03693 [Aspergillus calidoustus]
MARGNQRDKAREKNLKEAAKKKSSNTLSGSEFQRKKEDDALKMREKQAKASQLDREEARKFLVVHSSPPALGWTAHRGWARLQVARDK